MVTIPRHDHPVGETLTHERNISPIERAVTELRGSRRPADAVASSAPWIPCTRFGIPEGSDTLDFVSSSAALPTRCLKSASAMAKAPGAWPALKPRPTLWVSKCTLPASVACSCALRRKPGGQCSRLPWRCGGISERANRRSLAWRGVRIYFPDPWHKKRHNKRRLIQPDSWPCWRENCSPTVCCTWPPTGCPTPSTCWKCCKPARNSRTSRQTMVSCPQPAWRPGTKYEARGDRLGHETRDLLFRRRRS